MTPGPRSAWSVLFEHAETARAARPSASWAEGAARLVGALPPGDLERLVPGWFALFGPPADDPRANDGLPASPGGLIGARDSIFMRGLVWTCGGRADRRLVAAVVALAETCLAKVPDVGPLSAMIGHACIHALGATPGALAGEGLESLAGRVDYVVAGSLLEEARESHRAAQREDRSTWWSLPR